MEKKTHSRPQGTARTGRRLAGQTGGVPAWRDPQRMLGNVLGQALGGGTLLAIGAVVQHVHVAVSWR